LILILPPIDLLQLDQKSTANAPTIDSEFTGTDNNPATQSTSHQIPPTKEGLKEFAKEIAIKYGLDWEKFDYTIQNESAYNVEAVNYNGSCVGIGQYLLTTWLWMCGDSDNRTDGYKAISCMGKMWGMGMEYHWDAYCFKYYDEKCIKHRGIYPQ
jgi:hypothetical protein